jgi:wobble nucleotide-excising tRNase
MNLVDVKEKMLETKHQIETSQQARLDSVEDYIDDLRDLIKDCNADMLRLVNYLMESNGHYTKEEIEREDLYRCLSKQ